MSVKKPLVFGSTMLTARTLTSLYFCGDGGLASNAMGKFYVLQGSGLHHCVVDLIYGQCEWIDAVVPSSLERLQRQVHGIRSETRLPAPKGATAPFHAIVPRGWLLFEALTAWNFWP